MRIATVNVKVSCYNVHDCVIWEIIMYKHMVSCFNVHDFVIWEIIIYNTCMLVMFPINLDIIRPMWRAKYDV